MPDSSVQCGKCGATLDETADQANRRPCPNCGSTIRNFNDRAETTAFARQQLKMKVKDPTKPGRQSVKVEMVSGDELHRKSGKWYKKDRVIDKENDRYIERVTDPATGEVIHDCDEPLSEHRGHGSAKSPR